MSPALARRFAHRGVAFSSGGAASRTPRPSRPLRGDLLAAGAFGARFARAGRRHGLRRGTGCSPEPLEGPRLPSGAGALDAGEAFRGRVAQRRRWTSAGGGPAQAAVRLVCGLRNLGEERGLGGRWRLVGRVATFLSGIESSDGRGEHVTGDDPSPPRGAGLPPEDPRPASLLARLGTALREDAEQWCRERSWEVRVPVLLFFAYLWVRHLGSLEYGSFLFNGINLGIHEAGHILFRPFGEFLMLAGGTILQLLAPVVAAFAFWKTQRDYFAGAFCLGWLGTNLFNCAVYAADARGQLNLPLVSPWGRGFGADGVGDWTRMLGRLGLLEWDTTISTAFRWAASASFLLCLLFGAWLLWQMHRARREG
ncbi:MAG: hypothetical protein D6731_04690 [Planctomycetota bacterium]|nr:MAG: hypothetical protein D6731_04690 [Planctomycetota bacterium]